MNAGSLSVTPWCSLSFSHGVLSTQLLRTQNAFVPVRDEGVLDDRFRGTTLVDQRGYHDDTFLGGAEGARTPDLNTASVALSQLSYSPRNRCVVWHPSDDPLRTR